MTKFSFRFLLVLSLSAIVLFSACNRIDAIETTSAKSADANVSIAKDISPPTSEVKKGEEVAVFAGGCFLGIGSGF